MQILAIIWLTYMGACFVWFIASGIFQWDPIKDLADYWFIDVDWYDQMCYAAEGLIVGLIVPLAVWAFILAFNFIKTAL